MNTKPYDKEYITFLFNKFIEIAPIGNWKVELTFLNKNEMYDLVGRDDCHGVTIYKDYIELANIYLNVDSKYNDWESPEQTLFHELTHVEMRYFDEYVKSIVEVPDLYNTMRERFVNNIATAMQNMIKDNRIKRAKDFKVCLNKIHNDKEFQKEIDEITENIKKHHNNPIS